MKLYFFTKSQNDKNYIGIGFEVRCFSKPEFMFFLGERAETTSHFLQEVQVP